MKSPSVRIWLIGSLLLMTQGCGVLYDWVGGDFVGEPSQLMEAATLPTKTLIASAFAGLEEAPTDFHVHVAGLGATGSGAFVNPKMRNPLRLMSYGKFRVYLSASGVTDVERADEQYVERLLDLMEHSQGMGKCFLYAMEKHYRPDGSVDLERTPGYVPNEYVVSLAEENPTRFIPVISVHPYRKDALEELDKWAQRGCKYVKWIPNSMGIDPSSPQTESFYAAMLRHGMVLFSHTGDEAAVEVDGLQNYGNPLLLRKPLDLGLTVVALHCASSGEDIDLEDPERKTVPSFDLFLRLMDDPNYQKQLFGELAAITFFNHLPRPLEVLLDRPDLHDRLVYGSDYPLPAVNVTTWLSRLESGGFVTLSEADSLRQIYGYNPLLFDFVLKRTVRSPKTGRRFARSVFSIPAELRR